jgi:hypothetical protein
VPIVSGAYAARRFKVTGNPDAGNPTAAARALQDNAFPFDWTGAGMKTGWVSVDNLLDANFESGRDWAVGSLYVFSMRVDNRAVPPALLRAHVEKAAEAWRKEHDRTRIPREIKREIKEQVTLDLLQNATPRTRIYDVCWDLTTSIVNFSGLSDALVDQFRMLFQRTFGCTLEPVHLMGEEVKSSEVSDFYLWLWWACENGQDIGVETATIDGRITLSNMNAVTTVAADTLDQVPEARIAALKGKRPTSLKIAVVFNELAFSFTLQGVDIDITGLKIPDGSGDAKGQRFDREATILDRMALYDAVQDKVGEWVKQYETLKAATWSTWLAEECNPWLEAAK